ncbi:MAG: zinc ribbon domain-containing protein [Gemmatimonadota bacterium]
MGNGGFLAMPTYEYRCPKGHHFELFQKMSEDPRAECPECGAESERQISGGLGFLFKGDGFYITDHRSDSYKKDASKEETGPVSEKAAAKKPEKGGEPRGEPPSTSAKVKDSGSTSPPAGGSSSEGS